jgi:hypothetical protein
MSTCNQLDMQTLESQTVVMLKNLPDHCFTPRLFNTGSTLCMVFGVTLTICNGPKQDA